MQPPPVCHPSCVFVCVCPFVRVGVYEHMKVDQRKFGKAAWTAAVERMERLRYSVAKETLQLQRAREICLEQRKHTLREEVLTHSTLSNTNTHPLTHYRYTGWFMTPFDLLPSDAESV